MPGIALTIGVIATIAWSAALILLLVRLIDAI
jgi:hypothetical protein